jgi:hypothetical protein
MTSIGGVREGADNIFSIMVEGVRSDVLVKIDEYMCFFFDINNTEFYVDWNLNFFPGLPADMLIKLNAISKPFLLLNIYN